MSTYVTIDPSEKPVLDRLRARAKRHRLRIEKSRQQPHSNQRGGLQIVDVEFNAVVEDVNYELTVAQASYWVDDIIAKSPSGKGLRRG